MIHIVKDIAIPASIARDTQENGCNCNCNCHGGSDGGSGGTKCNCRCS